MKRGLRLRTLGGALTIAAFAAGMLASWLWLSSAMAWNRHLMRAYVTGFGIYETLRTGAPLPEGVRMQRLDPDDAQLATQGAFARLPGMPTPAYVTTASILTPGPDPVTGEVLALGLVSDRLRYAVSDLPGASGPSAAQKLGDITQLMATYCSEPLMFARLGDGPWLRIDGLAVWGCHAAPTDRRLPAVLAALAALSILLTLVAESTAHFDRFARALRGRRRLGGPDSYAVQGPEELRDIVNAVNSYLEVERAQLSKRAAMLSGVSHDLGTPATRLRLRTALIADTALRDKLDADIDRMTGMIEGVLTYTRSELDVESPRQMSLRSLIESIVSDYQDVGSPVTFRVDEPRGVGNSASVFNAHRGQAATLEHQRILASIRPQALTRAVSNLIDNALKYGRRAHVTLSATASEALIVVEDEGDDLSAPEMEALVSPFARGVNAQSVSGFGLGLTIVATVAEQHNGDLGFETGTSGLRACLRISRA